MSVIELTEKQVVWNCPAILIILFIYCFWGEGQTVLKEQYSNHIILYWIILDYIRFDYIMTR